MVTTVTCTGLPCQRKVIRLMTPNKARKSPKMLTNWAIQRVRNGRCWSTVLMVYAGVGAAGEADIGCSVNACPAYLRKRTCAKRAAAKNFLLASLIVRISLCLRNPLKIQENQENSYAGSAMAV